MANKTIPELPEITGLQVEAIFPVDTGTETFKISLENLRKAVFPTGFIDAFAGGTPPPGWLFCDGTAISRGTYAALFAIIGTTFGAGDGSTTFNLPDLRGRVIAGRDDMGGAAANRLTNGVAGFVGTTLGASGGLQNYTPAGSIGGSQNVTPIGTIGGSQSIAHTHTITHTHSMAHTHTFAHGHQWARDAGSGVYNTLTSQNSATTTFTAGDFSFTTDGLSVTSGSRGILKSTTGNNFYTGGVLGGPGGTSGAGATTSGSSQAETGPTLVPSSGSMSVNNTVLGSQFSFSGSASAVNGSNFTFTGSANNKVQPTMILNYLIRH